jgi:hypothetical protein
MSKACSSGTPARSIVDSCRVNIVMSFSVIFLPFGSVCLVILVTGCPGGAALS